MTPYEFDELINPTGSDIYTTATSTLMTSTPPKRVALVDVLSELASDSTAVAYWDLCPDYIVLETKQKDLQLLVAKEKPDIIVIETPDTLQFIAKSPFNKTTVNNMATCGADINTYAHSKKGTRILFPVIPSTTVASLYTGVKVLHAPKTLGVLPDWLLPIYKNSTKTVRDTLEFPVTCDTYIAFYELLTNLKKSPLTGTAKAKVIRLINDNLANTPLNKGELDRLFTAFAATKAKNSFFTSNKEFLHYKMGDYLIGEMSIKRNVADRQLYYYSEKEQIYVHDDDYLLCVMTRLCPSLKDFQKKEVLKYLEAVLVSDATEFDSDPFQVVFKNGVLDLDTMKLEPLSNKYLNTIKLAVNYDPTAKQTNIDEFFETATEGNKDVEQLLYEAIGYSMLKTNELQKYFILTGSGRNGKSTYLDLIRAILGENNVASISFKDLANTFRASTLIGKLASLAGDISNQPLSDSDLVKSISAGEKVTLEEKYKSARDVALFSTLFFAANTLPRTPDTTQGFYRRMCIIPFNANLDKVTRVKGLRFKRELLKQNNLDYIAYKAITAINDVLNNEDFTTPDCVTDMLKKYKLENSSVLSFWEDNYNSDLTSELMDMGIDDIYSSYTIWAEMSNRRQVHKSRFINEFLEATKCTLNSEDKLKAPS